MRGEVSKARQAKEERLQRERKYHLAYSTYLGAVMPESGYTWENHDIETNKFLDAFLAMTKINHHVYNDGYCKQDAEEYEIPLLRKYVDPVLGRFTTHELLYKNEEYLEKTINDTAVLAVKNYKPPIKLIALQYKGKTVAVRLKLTRRSFDVSIDKAKELNLPMHIMKTKLDLHYYDGELITDYEGDRLWFESYKLALDITDEPEMCDIISKVTWDLARSEN